LAKVIIDIINQDIKEINVGGPDLFTQNELAKLALKAHGKPIKIIHVPDWIRKLVLWTVRTFTNQKTYGPIEFFLTIMAMDMQAPQYGKYKLENYFSDQVNKNFAYTRYS